MTDRVVEFDNTDPVHRALFALTEALGSSNQVVNGTNMADLDPDVVPIDWQDLLEELRQRPELGPVLMDVFRQVTSNGGLGMQPATADDFASADRQVVLGAVICMKTYKRKDGVPDDLLYSVAVLEDGMIITHNEPGSRGR